MKNVTAAVLYRKVFNRFADLAIAVRERIEFRRGLAMFKRHDDALVGDFWESAHSGCFRLWLTGSTPPDVFRNPRIEELVEGRPLRILNVGVGEGHDTRELARLGHQIDALDISQTALDRVADVVTNRYRPSDYDRLPPATYDLVLHHLVAQHMSDADLQEQLAAVVPTLTADGIFAMQFAASLDLAAGVTDDAGSQKGGSVLRPPDRVRKLCAAAGGIVTKLEQTRTFPHFNSAHYCVHIARPDEHQSR